MLLLLHRFLHTRIVTSQMRARFAAKEVRVPFFKAALQSKSIAGGAFVQVAVQVRASFYSPFPSLPDVPPAKNRHRRHGILERNHARRYGAQESAEVLRFVCGWRSLSLCGRQNNHEGRFRKKIPLREEGTKPTRQVGVKGTRSL